MAGRRVAVIDVGSNSGRVVVLEQSEDGVLEVIDELRAPLRLARALDFEGRLTPEAFDTTIQAIGDFVALAHGQGAEEIRAVGTFAMREAQNGGVLVELIRERFDVHIEIVDGQREARFGFAGAVYGIDVEDGLSVDIGGGSLQIVEFRERTALRAWTFPFGALRLTDQFIISDPPKQTEIRLLRRHIRRALSLAGVPALAEGQLLVGTGGAIRNLAKIDLRRRSSPVQRLHGYMLERPRLRRSIQAMTRVDTAKRASIVGLNSSRADSIVAGSLAVDTVMRYVGAEQLAVSGQGLREGLIRATLLETLPPPEAVRRSSIRSLCRAFIRWNQPHADRRAHLAVSLFDLLLPDGDSMLREAIEHAAQVIDVGATIDVYNRHQRSADVILESDLQGFDHRMLVAISAILRLAERPETSLKVLRPIVDTIDAEALEAAAAILELADEIERRSPPQALGSSRVTLRGDQIQITAPVSAWWSPATSVERFASVFGVGLEVSSATLV